MFKNILALARSKNYNRKLLTPLFDEEFYQSEYPDLAAWRGKLIDHYLLFGSSEGRNPNRFFDSNWYLSMNSDIKLGGRSALQHYIEIGESEGRWPHPLFNPRWYLDRHEDVSQGGISPFQHFFSNGMEERREFSPFFDMGWYMQKYPEVATSKVHPAVHFLTMGVSQSLDPNDSFSSTWYLADNPDVARSGVHPYIHYLRYGRFEGRPPLPHITYFKRVGFLPKVELDFASFHSAFDASDVLPSTRAQIPDLQISTSAASVVSFDVWSTLLHRDCHPDEIKFQSARALFLISYLDLKEGFRNIRDLYRSRLRAENKSAPKGDFEYRFDDAIPLWLAEVLHPHVSPEKLAKLATLLMQHEIVAEKRATHRDDSVNGFLKSLEKPVLFVSDFYLSSDVIEGLLRENGVAPLWMKRYSSSDYFENKRSGRLFSRILSDLNLKPSELLHIGDNAVADRDLPAALGINTYLYEDFGESERTAWFGKGFDALLQGNTNIHERRILALLEELCDPTESELFAVGIRLSIIAFSFCLSVLEDAISRGTKTVFFFTREGIFFRDVYNAIVAADPYNLEYPSSAVLPVSRRATFAASLKTLDPNELMRLWSMYSTQSLRGLTSSLNLDEETVKKSASKYDLNYDEPMEFPWKNQKFLAMIKDEAFIEHAELQIAKQKHSLSLFLKQNNFEDGNGEAVIVDIGWRGTIQDNLAWLTNFSTRGHYLALFQFLNTQHPKSSKTGWLGDVNNGGDQGIRDQVAPLEMLFNGIGGSVSSYEERPDGVAAVREIIPAEELVVKRIEPIQKGMLHAVEHLTRYVRLHGLTATDLRQLARDVTLNLVEKPPTSVADIFGALTHNESFGTGQLDEVGGNFDPSKLLKTISGRELHYSFGSWLENVRWPEAAVRQENVSQWWNEANLYQKAFVPLAVSKTHSPAILKLRGNRVAVYAPGVLRASGGHRTIFNVTRRLADMGMEPYIFLDGLGDGIPVVEEYLTGTGAHIHTSWSHSITASIAFATIAHSASYVAQNVSAASKFYLVQDAEALFNPVGDAYLVGENSYAQGLQHITIGNWLTHVIQNQYDASASPAGLGVDTAIYRVLSDGPRENAVCMLYQPEKPRRGNALALAALRLLKQWNPDIQIYMYGSNVRAEIDFDAVQLGVITDLKILNSLYNKCRAGLCISLSNPSRIPFEMMAAGCRPVDLYRYNNLMDYDSEMAVLAYQNPSSVALALEIALAKTDEKTLKTSIAKPSSRTLEWENDAVVGHVLASVEQNGNYGRFNVSQTYLETPVIFKDSDTHSAEAFCAWQRRLADARITAP